MPKRPVPKVQPPTPTSMAVSLPSPNAGGHDEVNVAQLSLISAQSRVPESYTTWTRTYQVGERTVTVTCTALTGEVVPHGLDNDVMVAIINLYIEDGCPDDGTVTTTLRRLLNAAGLATTAHYYREVRQSLRRLQSTHYQILQGWWAEGRQRHMDATFSYLWQVVANTKDMNEAATLLDIRLPDEMVLSIREGYVKPLNLALYRELSSPPVRAVYRVLDALRWGSGQASEEVKVKLLDLGERLSIYSSEPDKIRRVLHPAHEELQERGVLKEVICEGRGRNQELIYRFASQQRTPDPELLQALIQRGMFPGVAGRHLADNPDHDAVRIAIQRFDAYPGLKQNQGALLRDMLLNPQRYQDVVVAPQAVPSLPPQSIQGTEEQAEQVIQKQKAELLSLPIEKQVSRVHGQLKLLGLLKLLSTEELFLLDSLVTKHEVSSYEVIQLLASQLNVPTEVALQRLKALLDRKN